MRFYFARMFVLLVLSVATGCTASHYEGDSVNGGDQIIGYVRTTANVSVQMRNLLTNNWDTVATRTPATDESFWYTSYKLYEWTYTIPTNLNARYRDSGGWVDIRFKQGNTLLMTFDPAQNTTQPPVPVDDPIECVITEYGLNYTLGTDYYYGDFGIPHLLRQQPFMDCGLITTSGADGNLRLHVN